jgi:dTDP-4-dehydrorhamnose 3,5-epimerase
MLISPIVLGDERGFFCERFRVDHFKEGGIANPFIQENFSRSAYGILRGLHYQWDLPQSKLITCTRGVIWDVLLDIRVDSPTFGHHLAIELSGDNPQWVWAPAGFAHGFLVLSKEGADLSYKVDALWNGKGEGGILWNDPDLNICWPIEHPILSEKDRKALSLKDYKKNHRF